MAYVHQDGLRLEWNPVTQDIFGRSIGVYGYKIYSLDQQFEGRTIGHYEGATSSNFFNLGFTFPYQIRYFNVTAYTAVFSQGEQ